MSYHPTGSKTLFYGDDFWKRDEMTTEVEIKGKDGILMTFFHYKGLNLPKAMKDPVKRFKQIEEIKYQVGDVIITTFPKTGTHWVSALVHMLLHNTTEHRKGPIPILDFPPDLTRVLQAPAPRLMVTHQTFQFLPKEHKQNKGKMVLVLRNPKDIAVSMFHFVKKETSTNFLGTWEEFFDIFCDKSKAMYCDYIDYILEWEQIMKDNPEYEILPVFYEDLKKDCVGELRRICKYLEVDRPDSFLEQVAEACKIGKTREKAENDPILKQIMQNVPKDRGVVIFYRKGEVGDWKNLFTVAQNQFYDKILESKLKDCAFKFEYELKSNI